MSGVFGGQRHRLIADSLFNMVNGCLIQLNWMTKTSWHEPVVILPDAVDDDEEVVFNTVAVSEDGIIPSEFELGSSMTQDRWNCWFDCYTQNAVVGKTLGADIRDILIGLHPDVGRTAGGLIVLDYTQATPVPLFNVDICNVDLVRVRTTTHPWQRFWWTVRCDLIDEYNAYDA